MRRIIFSVICTCFFTGLWAQEVEQPTGHAIGDAPTSNLKPQTANFKPRYAGTSVDMGYMFMPRFGSGFYVAPKFRFQATPRLFVNTGISIVQYNLFPSPMKYTGSPQRTATGAYIFAEGMYLLNERWSVNGSVMKNVTPESVRRATPYHVPSEAAHFGVDYKITPNITVGARVGYSNGGRSSTYGPFYPY